MSKEQKKEEMKIRAIVVCMDGGTGESKVKCLDWTVAMMVNPYEVVRRVREHGALPVDAEELFYHMIVDEDDCRIGSIFQYQDKEGRTYRVILEGGGMTDVR